MTDLEKLKAWLHTCPGAQALRRMQVDYTSSLPGCFGVFPAGRVELARQEDILGGVRVRCQYNFALYLVREKSPGDDLAAAENAEWVMALQRWVQDQSARGLAPRFGTDPDARESLSAQNGALYEASDEGLALYLIQLTALFTDHYPAG